MVDTKTIAKSHPKPLSVVIVDSGLGGLAICAAIVEGLRRRVAHESVALTYYNAWPYQDRGYNALASASERLRAFDAALEGTRAFAPDVVLIACNTLSILYPRTAFRKAAHIPVVGIVDFGVDLMLRHLAHEPNGQIVLMGTLTTIRSAIHRDSLVAHGIEGYRIVSQPCDQLATAIESGPDSPRVRAMIDDFAVQALSALHASELPVAVALCCTHYGYSAARIQSSFEASLGSDVTLLNPNDAMADHFLERYLAEGDDDLRLGLQVVSRIEWHDDKVAAIAAAIQTVSPTTADALRQYRLDPNLFTV